MGIHTSVLLVAALAVAGSAVAVPDAAAGSPSPPGPEITHEAHHDTSAALRALRPKPPSDRRQAAQEPLPAPRPAESAAQADPVVRSRMPEAAPPLVDVKPGSGGAAGRRRRGGQHDGDLGAGAPGGDQAAPVVPVWATVGGVGATLAIGAVAGLYPAIRAARLAPTETLAAP